MCDMIKFSNYPTTVLLRDLAADATTIYVDSERLRSYPSVDADNVKEGVFFVIEDIYGRYEACYASQIDLNTGVLGDVRRGLGNMAAQEWNIAASGSHIRVEIRPSAQVLQRMVQRDGDEIHGGWWDKESDPWAATPTFATDIITRFNDQPSADPPQELSLKPGQLAIYRERKTLWFGDKDGKTHAIQGGANNVVNVMDYGALGNGTTDDIDAIDEAIDDAIDRKACVFFPAGTFRITRPIRIERPDYALSIHGCGMRATIIACEGTTAWCAFYVRWPKFFSIKDLSLTTDTTSAWPYLQGPRVPTKFGKNPLDPAKGSCAIYVDGQYSWASQVYRAAEYVFQASDVEFSGSAHSHNTGWAFGIGLDGTGNAVISRCVFLGHIRNPNAPIAENSGGQAGVVRFNNSTDLSNMLITGCLASGMTHLATCKGLANSIQLIGNTAFQCSRLFTSGRIEGDKLVSAKFVLITGNVVNCFWAFASVHNIQAASITGNWCRTLGENYYVDAAGLPFASYPLLSISSHSTMVSGNYFRHIETNKTTDTDIIAIYVHDNSKEAVITGNIMKACQLGLHLSPGTTQCERHANVYLPSARTMVGTDGKVLDESEHNIKPVGGAFTMLKVDMNEKILPGGSYTFSFVAAEVKINEINTRVDTRGYIIVPDGTSRIRIDGLVSLSGRSENAEVQCEILKRANKDHSGVFGVTAVNYYGKGKAVLSPHKVYINDPDLVTVGDIDSHSRFTLRVLNRGPSAVTIVGNAVFNMFVLGYEE